eukprot:357496-Chlamydomonas_euryale.AAC.4
MDSATTRYSRLVSGTGSTLCETATPNATNANSPPGASSSPARTAVILDSPNSGPTAAMTLSLPVSSSTRPMMTSFHLATNSWPEISMPTDMKNRPISRPCSRGATWFRLWARKGGGGRTAEAGTARRRPIRARP